MCNTLHKGFKPIKESGIGYKIFNYYHPGIGPMFGWSSGIKFKLKSLNKWNLKLKPSGDGFCFFLTKSSAERYEKTFIIPIGSSSMYHREVKKIEYHKGLGKIRHRGWNSDNTFSICKEFKILND